MSTYYNLEASEVRKEFILAITTICFIGEKVKGNTNVHNFFHSVATLKTGQEHGGVVCGREEG